MNLQAALAKLSPEETQAVWQALAQYVENGQCNEQAEDPYEADPLLVHAESVLAKLDAEVARVGT